jgi:phosphonate transport system permease protein
MADNNGYFKTEVEVRPLVAAEHGAASNLRAEISYENKGISPSPALIETIDETVLTLLMALIGTSLAALVAVPVSFLGAGNIMDRGPMTKAVYNCVRLFLNVTRTFEPLVLATIFGLWVGFGPFAGVLALMVFTTGSLGKMFSEVVENIDPGPVEAVAATGASYIEQVAYAVIPQIVPDFTSYAIYHWDINVRISTIIGFVGGGGIGHLLNQRLKSFAYHQAGTALWAIILVVWVLDVFSASIRKHVV